MYVPRQLSADDASGGDPLSVVLQQQMEMQKQVAEVIRRQKAEDRGRRLTLIIGGIGALFAAARLGIIAIPLIRERRRK